MVFKNKSFGWLYEHVPTALLLANREGEIISVNPKAEALLGTSQGKLTKMRLSEIFVEAPNLQQDAAALGFYQGDFGRSDVPTQVLGLRPEFGGCLVHATVHLSESDKEPLIVSLADLTLVGQSCRLDIIFGEAYRQVAEGTARTALLNDLCVGLADALSLPFVWMGQLNADGNIVLKAASNDGPLSQELRHVPERNDKVSTGNGPAGQALRKGELAITKVTDKGFMPWRKAAVRQHIAALAAWPLQLGTVERQEHWVIVFASAHKDSFQDSLNLQALGGITRRLLALCITAGQSEERRMICQAVDSAGNAVFITNTEGNIQWANPAFARISAHPMEEIVGRNPRFLQSGKQGLRYYQNLWRTIQAGKVWRGETIDRDRNGELYTIHQTVSPVMSQGGRITHYISIHDDISDQKAMQQSRERARRMDEITGLLTAAAFSDQLERAANYSHNSGEPLALILLAIEDFETLLRSLGGDIEELILSTLGERIQQELSDDDFAAYLGGGDFAIVLRSIGNREEAEAVSEGLLTFINEPFPLLGDKLYLPTTTGVALSPEDATEAEALMKAADARAAMATGAPVTKHRRME